jgi:hypothetical protein
VTEAQLVERCLADAREKKVQTLVDALQYIARGRHTRSVVLTAKARGALADWEAA